MANIRAAIILRKETRILAASNSIIQALHSCFPDQWIRNCARDAGLVKRKSKIDIVAFFWTLILGFGTGNHRSLADLRRALESSTGVHVVASSFYDRFTVELCKFLKRAVAHVCGTMAEPAVKLKGKLAGFVDLVVADATVVTLHDLLEKAYKACRTNHSKAALKLHLVISVLAAGPRCVQLLSERAKEVQQLKVGPWVRNRLLLIDLGYYSFNLFERIDRNGGYFISRLKENANPLITATNRAWRGRSVQLIGNKLQQVLPSLRRDELDVMVDVTSTRREYRGTRSRVTKSFRLVGIRNVETGTYHLYLTNIPPDRLPPADVARTYAARWEVELIFKELKSQYRMDEIPSAKRHIVEALIYVAILTLTVSRKVLVALRRAAQLAASRTPHRRWASTFHTVAGQLLALVLDSSSTGAQWARLEGFLKHEFVDPNIKRQGNLTPVVG